jgi:4-amino-4-deoxy-L-arabinose transferase-like glycosyltransferase
VERLPRYWRYLVAALVGLAAGAVLRGTMGVIVGVFIALTIILIVESRTRSGSRRR